MRLIALACAVAVCLLAGCKNSQETSTTPSTSTAAALGGIDGLVAEANRTERLLEKRVKALTEIDSVSDLSPGLESLESELRDAAVRLQKLRLATELDAPRDGLAAALHSLAATVADLNAAVANLDVAGALGAIESLDLSDAEAAIAEIQRLAGG
jgi:hypothetical protein